MGREVFSASSVIHHNTLENKPHRCSCSSALTLSNRGLPRGPFHWVSNLACDDNCRIWLRNLLLPFQYRKFCLWNVTYCPAMDELHALHNFNSISIRWNFLKPISQNDVKCSYSGCVNCDLHFMNNARTEALAFYMFRLTLSVHWPEDLHKALGGINRPQYNG
jgi:hypothetical protein